MQNYIKTIQISLSTLLLIFSGILFNACDDDIIIGEVDETQYIEANKTYGFLRSCYTSRTIIPIEIRENTDLELYFGLTKIEESQISVTIGIDEKLVEEYNKENFTNYEVFPASLVTIENNGNISIPKFRKESDPFKVSLTKGELAETTYLLPLTIKDGGDISISPSENSILYMIKVSGSIPSAEKPGGIKTLCYVEVNNNNILNIGSYILEESGKPFFDIAVIFAANINYNEHTGDVYLNYNDNVQYILNNKDKYIKPLQDKGIKVILGLLNNHDFVGIANLSGESLRSFARQCKVAVDTYELDGVDFDDEWALYRRTTGSPGLPAERSPLWDPSGTKTARLIIEMKRLMPDKIITVFEYEYCREIPSIVDGYTMVDLIDFSMYPYYRSSASITTTNRTSIGMPNSKYSPKAINLNDNNDEQYMTTANLRTTAQNIKNGNYGLLFFYDLLERDESEHLSAASNVFWGENVICEKIYKKDW